MRSHLIAPGLESALEWEEYEIFDQEHQADSDDDPGKDRRGIEIDPRYAEVFANAVGACQQLGHQGDLP
jgi:hypothetical protein